MSSGKPLVERAAIIAVIALATSFATIGTSADAPASPSELKPFQASYVWSWNGAEVALSRLNFAHQQDDVWVYTSSTAPRGLGFLYPMRPKLESTMRITAQGVQPLHFTATGSGKRRDGDVTFDWEDGKGKAVGTYEGSPINLEVTPGVQDDMSVQIAMILQMVRGVTPDVLREIDQHGIRDYLYKRDGQETLTTAIGSIDTVIYRTEHPGSPRITRYWCAPTDGYIPVKVQQTLRDQVQWTMTLQSLKRE